jgi:ribosomal protein S27E
VHPGRLVPVHRVLEDSPGYLSDTGYNSDDDTLDGYKPRGYRHLQKSKLKAKVAEALESHKVSQAVHPIPTPEGSQTIGDMSFSDDEGEDVDPSYSPVDESSSDGTSTPTSDDGGPDSPDSPGAESLMAVAPDELVIKKKHLQEVADHLASTDDILEIYFPSHGHRRPRFTPRWGQLSTSADQVTCPDCNRSFSTNAKMRRHHRLQHQKEGGHKCNICEKLLATPSSLRRHLDTHSQEKQYQCDVCPKSYTSLKSLKSHKAADHPVNPLAPHVCKYCGKAFAKPKSGREHESRGCVKNPDFKYSHCPLCNTRFTRAKDVAKHLKKYHGQ